MKISTFIISGVVAAGLAAAGPVHAHKHKANNGTATPTTVVAYEAIFPAATNFIAYGNQYNVVGNTWVTIYCGRCVLPIAPNVRPIHHHKTPTAVPTKTGNHGPIATGTGVHYPYLNSTRPVGSNHNGTSSVSGCGGFGSGSGAHGCGCGVSGTPSAPGTSGAPGIPGSPVSGSGNGFGNGSGTSGSGSCANGTGSGTGSGSGTGPGSSAFPGPNSTPGAGSSGFTGPMSSGAQRTAMSGAVLAAGAALALFL